MTNEPCDAVWPDEERRLLLRDVAELSGLSEAEVVELVDCGALTPADETAGQRVFSVTSITVARAARRLREDFELETHGVALLLACLDRIHDLEAELRALRAQLPRRSY
jgi:chaperone modulatory protein CbpM